MDDIVIHSSDEDHADVLAWCLARLRSHNVQASPKKAFIGRPDVHFLGHIIDKDGLHIYGPCQNHGHVQDAGTY
jgi:hypothetical protein